MNGVVSGTYLFPNNKFIMVLCYFRLSHFTYWLLVLFLLHFEFLDFLSVLLVLFLEFPMFMSWTVFMVCDVISCFTQVLSPPVSTAIHFFPLLFSLQF